MTNIPTNFHVDLLPIACTQGKGGQTICKTPFEHFVLWRAKKCTTIYSNPSSTSGFLLPDNIEVESVNEYK